MLVSLFKSELTGRFADVGMTAFHLPNFTCDPPGPWPGVSLGVCAHAVRKHRPHHRAEQRDDRGLVGGDRIEVAHEIS